MAFGLKIGARVLHLIAEPRLVGNTAFPCAQSDAHYDAVLGADKPRAGGIHSHYCLLDI